MKKICFVTGSRADYGLLSHLMKSVEKDKNLKLQVIVTGSHLSKKFVNTKADIENDKIKIDKKIDILSKNDNPIDILKNTSIAIKKISLAINQLKLTVVNDAHNSNILTEEATLANYFLYSESQEQLMGNPHSVDLDSIHNTLYTKLKIY